MAEQLYEYRFRVRPASYRFTGPDADNLRRFLNCFDDVVQSVMSEGEFWGMLGAVKAHWGVEIRDVVRAPYAAFEQVNVPG